MYYIYQCLFWLCTPCIWLYLVYRSRKDQRYLQRCRERWGYYQSVRPCAVWIHAASVGEAIVALKVAAMIDKTCVITTMTPTGSAIVQQGMPVHCQHVYCPYDRADVLRRFLHAFQPQICLLVETELWPGWLYTCYHRDIPVWLLNGRCHMRSFQRYQSLRRYWDIFQYLKGVVAQSAVDQDRFIKLGVENTEHIANLKWVMSSLAQIKNTCLTVCAGSFHPPEIEQLLAQWAKDDFLCEHVCLILAPRHIENVAWVNRLIKNHQLKRCDNPDGAGVFVVDQMGVLQQYYNLADVCVIGGSFIEHGGQNPLEAAICAKPVIMGPSSYNFATPVAELMQAGGFVQAADMSAACTHMKDLLQRTEHCRDMGQKAYAATQPYQYVGKQYDRFIQRLLDKETVV